MRSNTCFIVGPVNAAGSSSTSALRWKAGPPTLATTISNSEASCHAWPPCASGVMPAALSLSAAASNSAQVVGILMPTLLNTAGLAYIQSRRWMFTGAATHWPLYFMVSDTSLGSACSQRPAAATSSIGCNTPSAPHSWISGPLSCTEEGGSPPITRVRSLASASSLLPPPTGVSIHLPPCDSRSSLSVFMPLAWPPEVMKCSTSTVGGPASAGSAGSPTDATIRHVTRHRMFSIACLLVGGSSSNAARSSSRICRLCGRRRNACRVPRRVDTQRYKCRGAAWRLTPRAAIPA